ncbi:hypothetical protein K3Z96_25605, partial [Pseudomonas aeruginosa]|nr:hypothetical protein [Pseudomonas aeruginosa]
MGLVGALSQVAQGVVLNVLRGLNFNVAGGECL